MPASPRHNEPAVVGRFQLREQLGAGALGVVYRATDSRSRQDVALKMLTRLQPDSVYRFKQEFRALSGLIHPNLVTLYGLQEVDGVWALAMELVEGARSLLQFVRPHEDGAAVDTGSESTSGPDLARTVLTPSSAGQSALESPAFAAEPPTMTVSGGMSVADETLGTMVSGTDPRAVATTHDARRRAIVAASLRTERLRAALTQLVRGVHALHQAGMLHRDLKPSNVLVDAAGRVVVCDFGLVSRGEREQAVVGTPAYASPEQLAGEPLGPASDWYSVGVMLYEALTGLLPVARATLGEIYRAKREGAIAPPATVDASVDAQLAALCMALLDRDPTARPGAEAILARLGVAHTTGAVRILERPEAAPFVGREAELAQLWAAFDAARTGRTVTVLVEGPSGVGKSALVAEVTAEARAQHGAVVLAGRCYEAESVAFKALDSVVDALAVHLLELAASEVEALLTVPVRPLAEQFPVLLRVPAIVARAQTEEAPEPARARGLAAEALAEILAGLARSCPTVVVIDDLQWGDLDSAVFLRELMDSACEPGLLMITTVRSDADIAGGGLVAVLRQDDGAAGRRRDLRTLSIAPLPPDDAARLAAAILGVDAASTELEAILRDAGGSPMFVAELAFARAAGEDLRITGGGLDALIERRAGALTDEPQALLEVVALAGRPQPLDLLARASKIRDRAAAVAHLRAGRFIRIDPGASGEYLAPYHDRIRETVARGIPDKRRRALHRRLARALESGGELDVDALVVHWRGAGDDARAARYAMTAAQRALRGRAYRRAADHLATVLALRELPAEERARLLETRADALAHAGSVEAAVEAYQVAADAAGPEKAAELSCRALVCLLRAGRMSDARALSRRALAAVGLSPPPTVRRAFLSIAWQRAAMLFRPPRVRRTTRAEDLPASVLRRLDVSYAVATALGFTDTIPGFAVHTRFYREALALGEPHRAAKALSAEAAFIVGMRGSRAGLDCDRLLRRAAALADERDIEPLAGLVDGWRAFVEYLVYRDVGATAPRLFAAAERASIDPTLGWEADIFRLYACNSLALSAQMQQLRERLPAWLRHARETGNDYLAMTLRRSAGCYLWLANDDPAEAARQLAVSAEAVAEPLTVDDWYQMIMEVEVGSYAGDTERAVSIGSAYLRAMRGTSLVHVVSLPAYTYAVMARAHLRRAVLHPETRTEALREARKLGRRLLRSRRCLPEFAEGFGGLIAGLVARAEGKSDEAREALRVALARLDASGMVVFAAPARLVLADLVGGEEGRTLRTRVTAWAREQGIVNLDRFVAWSCPSPAINDPA